MGKKEGKNRRRGREIAFQILYGCSFAAQAEYKDIVQQTWKNFFELNANNDDPASVFAAKLIEGVLERQKELDKIIEHFSINWRLERIAKVELTILRLSVYEMLFCQDNPGRVIINEGIELGKKFGDSKSSRFINGILDAVANKHNIETETTSL